MKKILCIMMSVLTLIAAAGCKKAPDAAPTDPATPVESAGTPPVFQLDELPEIGGFADEQQVRYFFEDGPHDTFEPREDYGGVIPYIAGYRTYSTPEFYTYTDEETGETVTDERTWTESFHYTTYGLMTADGRIITNGIWDEISVSHAKDGFAVLRMYLEDAAPEGYGDYILDTVVSADGRWKLEENDAISAGVISEDHASFYVQFTDRYDIYDRNCKRLFSVPIAQNNEAEDYYTSTTVSDADEDGVTIYDSRIYNRIYEGEPDDIYSIIRTDWAGKEQWRFDAPYESDLLGDYLFVPSESYEANVYTKDGKLLDDTGYLRYYYSEKDRLYLVSSGHDDEKIEYRDSDWAEVTPEKTGWTEELTEKLNLSEIQPLTEGSNIFSVYGESDNDKYIDFYGFPIKKETDKEITELRTESDFMLSDEYLIGETADNALQLFSMDGKLITTTVLPEKSYLQPLRGYEIENGYFVYLTAENDIYLFHIATGEEERLHPRVTDALKEKHGGPIFIENMVVSENYVTVRDVYKNALLLYSETEYSEDEGYTPGVLTLCPRANAKFTEQTVLNSCEYFGYLSIVSATDYSVYAPDGTLLLKLRNEENL